MKKAFSVLAVLFILLAAGCENQKANNSTTLPDIPTAFTSNISITYGDIEMTALLTQNAAEDYTVKFLTPDALSPLSLSYKNGVCNVTYDDLMFESDLNRFPQTQMATLLTDSISDVIQDIDIEKTYSDGIWSYKGTGERGMFTLRRDSQTGAWLDLSIDGAKLSVIFSDFKQN